MSQSGWARRGGRAQQGHVIRKLLYNFILYLVAVLKAKTLSYILPLKKYHAAHLLCELRL